MLESRHRRRRERSDQPLATYNPNDPNSSVDTPGAPPGAAPTWCPYQAGPTCDKVFPADIPQGLDLPSQYMANVSTVGQDKTPSPWGTYDQGGNVVEILDTLAPQPPGYNFLRDWRYYHGGVANAPAYQMEISAFGYNPGNPALQRIYPGTGSVSASSETSNRQARTPQAHGEPSIAATWRFSNVGSGNGHRTRWHDS